MVKWLESGVEQSLWWEARLGQVLVGHVARHQAISGVAPVWRAVCLLPGVRNPEPASTPEAARAALEKVVWDWLERAGLRQH